MLNRRVCLFVCMLATVVLGILSLSAAEPNGQSGVTVRDGSAGEVPLPSGIVQQELFFPAEGDAGAEKALNLYIDLSHSPLQEEPLEDRYSQFIATAQTLGFNVNVASDFTNLMYYDVALFVLPQDTFSAAEASLIESYLDAGKVLILFSEWGDAYPTWTNLAVVNLLADLTTGISVGDNQVEDPVQYFTYTRWILIDDFADHCLNEEVDQIVMPRAGRLFLDNPDSTLFWSSENSYLLDTSTYGPFPMGAIPDPTLHPNWKLFMIADTNTFSTDSTYGDFFNMYDNKQLAINVMLWCPCHYQSDCDDGLYCNGQETCNTTTYQCEEGTPPDCGDDGLFCNGTESCDEENDQCASTEAPCPDDGLYCNGVESCNEGSDSCETTGQPCSDDDRFCNGGVTCNEETDACDNLDPPCLNDGQFCNGVEFCDEETDACRSTEAPCPQDDLFCNGTETCDEESDACLPGDPPCPDGTECNEETDSCDSRGDDDDSDSGVEDDDDDDDKDEDEEEWPKGEVTGGCCGCD